MDDKTTTSNVSHRTNSLSHSSLNEEYDVEEALGRPSDLPPSPPSDISMQPLINNPKTLDHMLPWSRSLIHEFRLLAYNSAGYAWMYSVDAQYYFNLNNTLNIVIGVLSTFAAIGMGGALTFIQDNAITMKSLFYVFSIGSIVLNLIICMISAYKSVLNLEYRIQVCLDKAAKYGKLYRAIKLQFVLPQDAKDSQDTFARYVSDRYDELDREKPFLRKSTVKQWNKHQEEIQNNPDALNEIIPFPDEFGRDRPLSRSVDGSSKKQNEITKYIRSML